jgi:hypothetical protein
MLYETMVEQLCDPIILQHIMNCEPMLHALLHEKLAELAPGVLFTLVQP